MSEAQKDTQRSTAASIAILDGRTPDKEFASILVTLEQTVAAVLLAVMQGNAKASSIMLNEGLVQGVERRLAQFEAVMKAK